MIASFSFALEIIKHHPSILSMINEKGE